MYLIWLRLLFLVLLITIINTTNLRCYEDINESVQLIDHCRTCVIFIDIKLNPTFIPKQMFIYDQPSIEELFLYDETKSHRSRRSNINTVVHQKCARESDGPLYGFDRTHCYCNSNLCNSNIQRCIYEIASKRYFSCYHGTNSSQTSLEIYKKCRSCRIRKQFDLTYQYECLTFGEQEQRTNTQCTCQHPMCNQDLTVCQRFQQIPSQSRFNFIHKVLLNSTKSTPKTYTLSIKSLTTLLITNQTERNFSKMENSTSMELTSISCNDTNQIKTAIIQMKNHANFLSLNFYILLFFISYM